MQTDAVGIGPAAGVLDAAAPPIGLHEVTRGELLFKTSRPGHLRPAPTQHTQVEIRVTGPIARASVSQRFVNPSEDWAEAIYAFPLPENAAVDRLRLYVGERVIEGQIKEREIARATYEKAKKEGKKSALVEQHRPNLFTTSVANIPPKGEVRVEIEYQQPLSWQDERFSLRFPLAITPRYRPAARMLFQETADFDGGWAILPGEIPNSVPLQGAPPGASGIRNPVSLSVHLEPGFPLGEIRSRSHDIEPTRDADGGTSIRLSAGQVAADRDFLLEWTAAPGSAPRAAFFTEHTPAGDYGLLMVLPQNVDPDEDGVIEREIVFVIDTSGSMSGASIRQARAALSEAIRRLAPSDRFEVVQFNDETRRLFGHAVAVSERTRAIALAYVARLEAGGGTQMRPALQAALSLRGARPGSLRQVVFITDGAVGNEEELLGLIRQRLGDRRLFTVGIGSAPNSYFMTEAAHFGRGSFTYIAKEKEVGERMDRLLRHLEWPAMTDIALSLPVGADVLPNPLPDLYHGQPLVAVMKLDAIPAQAEASGRLADVVWRNTLTLSAAGAQRGLGVYWAREKIRHWMRRKAGGMDEKQVRSEIVDIALAHHIVSRYTSLVAVDVTPVRPVDARTFSHALDGNPPAGWKRPQQPAASMEANAGLMLAQGATWSEFFILAGLALLGLAVLLRFGPAFAVGHRA